jgi:pentalenene synthase
MRRIAAEVDAIHNDICSVEKEERWGDPHNLVPIIQRNHGLSRAGAIESMSRALGERTERFVRLEAGLPSLYASLVLSQKERATVDRYVADALRTAMRGDFDWAERSGRYDSDG